MELIFHGKKLLVGLNKCTITLNKNDSYIWNNSTISRIYETYVYVNSLVGQTIQSN